MNQTQVPDSIALRLPTEWTQIPLSGDGARAYREQVADDFLTQEGVSRTDARQLEVALSYLQDMATRDNVGLIGQMLALDDTSGDEAPLLIQASVVSRTLTRAEIGTSVPLMVDVLLSAFGQVDERDDVVTYDEIEPPSKITVNGLAAVRLVRLANIATGAGDPLRMFSETFVVPDERGDVAIILHFSTINHEYARQFSVLFGQIAQTMRILHSEDATFTEVPEA